MHVVLLCNTDLLQRSLVARCFMTCDSWPLESTFGIPPSQPHSPTPACFLVDGNGSPKTRFKLIVFAACDAWSTHTAKELDFEDHSVSAQLLSCRCIRLPPSEDCCEQPGCIDCNLVASVGGCWLCCIQLVHGWVHWGSVDTRTVSQSFPH